MIIWLDGGFAAALSPRRRHADTLIVPMSLVRDAYRAEIPGNPGTVILRSDRLAPAELADEVLAAGHQRTGSAK